MTLLAGNVNVGIAYIETHFLNRCAYDHAAAAPTRYGPRVPGQLFPSESLSWIMDCSGEVIRGAVEGGMPRWHEGFPESSGDMDKWADDHPDLLLWSKHGGGRYATLRVAVANAPRGAVFGLGDYADGDAGHTGYLLGPDGTTLESASSLGGCRYGNIWRFESYGDPVTHLYLLPMEYGQPAPPAPPPPPPPVPRVSQEDDVPDYIAQLPWPVEYGGDGNLHTFWLQQLGKELAHRWDGKTSKHTESITDIVHTGAFLWPQRPHPWIAPNGTLCVSVLGVDGVENTYASIGGHWVPQTDAV